MKDLKTLCLLTTKITSRYQITLDNLQLANKDFLLFHPGPVNWGNRIRKNHVVNSFKYKN